MTETLLVICLLWHAILTVYLVRQRRKPKPPAVDLRVVVKDLIRERLGEARTATGREALRARLAARADRREARRLNTTGAQT